MKTFTIPFSRCLLLKRQFTVLGAASIVTVKSNSREAVSVTELLHMYADVSEGTEVALALCRDTAAASWPQLS